MSQPLRLFSEKRIQLHFEEILDNIKYQIDSYSEPQLETIDVTKSVEELIETYAITVPSLEKDKTSSSITKQQLYGEQLPAGTPFVPGRVYEIEVANYIIPFSGDKAIFFCIPSQPFGHFLQAEIQGHSLLLQITNWGKISGNDEEIEAVKKLLLQWVDIIEKNLNAAQTDVNNFESKLKGIITPYLQEKIASAKTKKESSNKLNPFH